MHGNCSTNQKLGNGKKSMEHDQHYNWNGKSLDGFSLLIRAQSQQFVLECIEAVGSAVT